MPIEIFLIGVMPIYFAVAARAEVDVPPLTVEAAVAAALADSPRAHVAITERHAARAGVDAARSLTNPDLTLTPAIAGAVGSDEELTVVQPLEISGSRSARARVARAELQLAEETATVLLRDLVRDVRFAYYELARAREVLDLQRESVTTAEEFERIARRQVDLGARPGIDLIQLQIELIRARQLQTEAETDVRVAEATLNTLMGRAPQRPLPVLSRLSFAAATGGGPPSASQPAVDRRPEIRAEEARLQVLRQQARRIRAEGRPDVSLSGRIESWTRTPREGGVGLGLTLPLFDYGSRRNRVRQAERLAEAQAARVEVVRKQVRLDIEAALTRLAAAEQLVQRYQEGLLSQARRLAEAERTRFQTGAGSPLAVLEAQRTFRSVLRDYYAALADHARARAEYAWAVGDDPHFPNDQTRQRAPRAPAEGQRSDRPR